MLRSHYDGDNPLTSSFEKNALSWSDSSHEQSVPLPAAAAERRGT